jgi:KaiC/GvpD/RAD55 family RecA-like ATPase
MRGARNIGPSDLPPHDADAEAAALGCVLLENACLDRMRERFEGRGAVFYDHRHQRILQAMGKLRTEGKAIDAITLKDALGPDGVIACGGLVYLAGLPEQTPSPGNLDHYLDILWEKYLVRLQQAYAYDLAQRIREKGGRLSEADAVWIDEKHTEWKRLSAAGTLTPQLLSEPKEFAEDFYKLWYRQKDEEPGWKLAVPLADLRIRAHELVVFTAENGAGKTTYLGQLAIALAAQGARVVVASLEEHVPQTLYMLSRQLMGARSDRMEQTRENHNKLAHTLAWLQRRFRFYNFLGIGNWRDILDCFKYARTRLGYDVFILDSMMKVGIPDDDYAGQSVAVNAFQDFCLATGASTILVVHQNKSEGGASAVKRKVRGAGTVTDVANVLMSIRRNEKKEEKSTELWQRRELELRILDGPASTEQQRAAAKSTLNDIHREWIAMDREMADGEVRLLKQRRKGTRQNGRRDLWFDRDSLQFRGSPEDPVVNYMAHTVASVAATAAPGGAAAAEEVSNTNTNTNEKENES